MTRPQRPGRRDTGAFGPDIGSFRLHLAAEGKAARTVQGYTGTVRWFAADYLLGQAGKTSWEQVDAQDIQQWMAWLLHRYKRRIRQHPVPGAAAVLQVAGRGGAERDLMELNGWTSPQMLTRYGASARGARARRSYDRIMDGTS